MKFYDEGLAVLHERFGDLVLAVADDSAIVRWVKGNFPLSVTGMIEWRKVPSARIIILKGFDLASVSAALDELVAYVGARDDEIVSVLWHSDGTPLQMPLSICRGALDVILRMSAEEAYIASLTNNWLIELDSWDFECDGARIVSQVEQGG